MSRKGMTRTGRTPLPERFWAKVNRAGTYDCWLWTGSRTPQGYGHINEGGRNGKTLIAHRVSWKLHEGRIPYGAYVLHRCDVPACVNPTHLFLGTHADNMADCRAKGRGNGPRGERQHDSRVTRADAQQIRESRGIVPQRQLGKRFGLSKSQIGRIQRGESWAWI